MADPSVAQLLGDEPPGPVAVVEPYGALDVAIDRANGVRPGADTGLFTRSLPKVWQVFERLEGGSLVHNGHPHVLNEQAVFPSAQRPAESDARLGIEALSEARTLLVATPVDCPG